MCTPALAEHETLLSIYWRWWSNRRALDSHSQLCETRIVCLDYGNNRVIARLSTENITEITAREHSRLVKIVVLKNITFLVNWFHASMCVTVSMFMCTLCLAYLLFRLYYKVIFRWWIYALHLRYLCYDAFLYFALKFKVCYLCK